MNEIKQYIRTVPDFPITGIQFRDITSLCNNAAGFKIATGAFLSMATHHNATAVVAIESRGFIFGSVVARELKLPLILARKPGKLPNKTFSKSYTLEYGQAELHIQTCEPLTEHSRVVVIDDLIATGGTALACAELVHEQFSVPRDNIKVCAVVDLPDLGGSTKLKEQGYNTDCIVEYDGE